MRIDGVLAAARGSMRRVWGTITGRRADRDLQRELAEHVRLAEDDLVRKGHSPTEAARLARARAGGAVQALEALREQRGLPWVASSWLDLKLGLRLLVRNWGLTLVGGFAMAVTIGIAAFVFAFFDLLMWAPLPLEDGDRVVAIQMWDRQAGQRRDTAWQDVERWQDDLESVQEISAFQTIRRNVVTDDGSVELASVAEMTASGFGVARVSPILGRTIAAADERPGAPPVVVIGHEIWQRRFGASSDVIGRELRLADTRHTIIGVMPEGFLFPSNFSYWTPLRIGRADYLHDAGPEGVVFGRLAPGADLVRAHAEVTALGTLPVPAGGLGNTETTGPRVVSYTFAFTGDFERGDLALIWSLASLLLTLLLLPPCANIAILVYARTVTRQEEFAARHALGGSRGRIVMQLFIEVLLLAACAAGLALLALRVVLLILAGRVLAVPGQLPYWMSFDLSYRTVLFAAGLAVVGAAIAGLVPALQATGRLARLGAGALAGRTSLRLGRTWTTLVVVQVAFSVAALPLAAELAWGTLREGMTSPGFAAEQYGSARVSLQDDRFILDAGETPRLPVHSDAERRARAARSGSRLRELVRRLVADPTIAGVSVTRRAPGDEPWVFIEIEGVDRPVEAINGRLPGFRARFNHVDEAFFDLFDVPRLAGRVFAEADFTPQTSVAVVNRTFADTLAADGPVLGRRFRYVRAMGGQTLPNSFDDRWFEVVGVVDDLPRNKDGLVAYHPAAPGQVWPARLQLRMTGDATGLAGRLREVTAGVDPTLQVDEVTTLDAIYRDQRFGNNLGAVMIGAVTGSVLLLSAAGLYALMAFTVAQRRREIGIRTALGARPGSLMAGVFRRAIRQVGLGALIGMLAAWLIGRYVPIEQIGGLPIPGSILYAAVLMAAIGLLAAIGPARRGLRVDPIDALREG